MTEVIVWLKKKTGKLVYGLGVGVIFFLVFLPAKKINEYFESRNNGSLVVAGPNVTYHSVVGKYELLPGIAGVKTRVVCLVLNIILFNPLGSFMTSQQNC